MMSVDKAIRLARKWAAGHVCTLREGEAQEYHQLCAEALERSRWIPVTERLPELDSDVLCRLKGFCYGGRTQVCRYRKADKYINHPYFDHHRNGFPVVTHWMPLPTPPKED